MLLRLKRLQDFAIEHHLVVAFAHILVDDRDARGTPIPPGFAKEEVVFTPLGGCSGDNGDDDDDDVAALPVAAAPCQNLAFGQCPCGGRVRAPDLMEFRMSRF